VILAIYTKTRLQRCGLRVPMFGSMSKRLQRVGIEPLGLEYLGREEDRHEVLGWYQEREVFLTREKLESSLSQSRKQAAYSSCY
jgi:hypothetical protein